MSEIYGQYLCDECAQYAVIIEDDGRVCYAYLLVGTEIVGDVWLYNQADAPSETNWNNKEDMPFINPIEFAKVGDTTEPLSGDEDVKLEWKIKDDCILDEVMIFVRGQITAKLKERSTPGWSVNAKKDGPLAKVLKNE